MKIRNEVTLNVPLETAWEALNDIPRVARCAPGAKLLESRADDSHVGSIAVRLGPVALSFKGTVHFLERDDARHRVVAKAEGNEEKARGSAKAEVVFVLTPEETGTRLIVESDIVLAGYVAQYGRGAALIQSTAQVIMTQFANNLQADLNAGDGEAVLQKDISGATALAKGLWNAGVAMVRKDGKTSDSKTSDSKTSDGSSQ
jgi:carbon monoxide dehydrogenase subunit G